MIGRFRWWAGAFFSIWAALALAGEAPAGAMFIGVKVLKTAGAGTVDWAVELPADCRGCRLENNAFTSGQNAREFYFHFIAPGPPDKISALQIKVDPSKVRSVLVGHRRVSFERRRDRIVLDAPANGPLLSDLADFHTLPSYAPGDVTDRYTYLDTPSVQTRIEHADKERRAGPYAKGPWPATQRQAALNLEFGAREAIVALGIDRTIRERGFGTILLMGFDTNYPTLSPDEAHDDDPPHWHMHFSWSHDPVIRQIGHFYIGTDGLLTENLVSDVTTKDLTHYARGASHETRTESGSLLYRQTVTPQGFFNLSADQGSCQLQPVAQGFQSGVDVLCTVGGYHHRVRAEDDVDAGRIRVFVDDRLREEHMYDVDSGSLLSSKITYRDFGM